MEEKREGRGAETSSSSRSIMRARAGPSVFLLYRMKEFTYEDLEEGEEEKGKTTNATQGLSSPSSALYSPHYLSLKISSPPSSPPVNTEEFNSLNYSFSDNECGYYRAEEETNAM